MVEGMEGGSSMSSMLRTGPWVGAGEERVAFLCNGAGCEVSNGGRTGGSEGKGRLANLVEAMLS
jgi:hypothetical protein